MSAAKFNRLTHHVTFHLFDNNLKRQRFPFNFPNYKIQTPIKLNICLSSSNQSTHKIVHEFDPNIPIEEAVTPPSSWYFDPSFYSFEIDHVFYSGWRVVGCIDQIKNVHDYFTGRLGNVEYVICRDARGEIHAFHNVCRHHASVLAYGSGRKTCLVCPYHGWTYSLDGNLLKAPRITGIQNFDPKVFCDNYLDGGYHVPYAHKNLASGLNLDSYSTEMYEKVSIQRCASSSTENGDEFDRLGSKALYAFIYPNFMINRYGPWMDTNLVVPLGPRKCQVVFDYFLDMSLKDDEAFIKRSLKDSEEVQIEDIMLCEGVQRGLESPAYRTGRYAPALEKAMHHFHCLLYRNLTG
ncbi:choline monooxygenase, chloroplastic isoform X2 [Beta vulgaris subsp. vulgaris]|uniref:choline monooxygenase, chloroplastic isoform X2 n=1 Tax=Beta vulgaris subsp. vulgaris TaxID=3555 RepID=UPI0020373844|nr:choline monooxygenase, chloroplastic isoform X2 [Beta vulgaris subsp. vulgaris]